MLLQMLINNYKQLESKSLNNYSHETLVESLEKLTGPDSLESHYEKHCCISTHNQGLIFKNYTSEAEYKYGAYQLMCTNPGEQVDINSWKNASGVPFMDDGGAVNCIAYIVRESKPGDRRPDGSVISANAVVYNKSNSLSFFGNFPCYLVVVKYRKLTTLNNVRLYNGAPISIANLRSGSLWERMSYQFDFNKREEGRKVGVRPLALTYYVALDEDTAKAPAQQYENRILRTLKASDIPEIFSKLDKRFNVSLPSIVTSNYIYDKQQNINDPNQLKLVQQMDKLLYGREIRGNRLVDIDLGKDLFDIHDMFKKPDTANLARELKSIRWHIDVLSNKDFTLLQDYELRSCKESAYVLKLTCSYLLNQNQVKTNDTYKKTLTDYYNISDRFLNEINDIINQRISQSELNQSN